jgi:HK97 family phage major capsid protein
MRVQDILNECRKQLAQKENRSIIDVTTIGRDATKTVQKPMVALHPESLFSKLGVKVLDKLTNNVGYPVINSQTTMELQETENPQDFIDNLSFDSITLKPRRFFSYVQYDRQIILSNDADVVGAMTEDLEASILEEVERKAFNELYVDGGAATITSYSDIVALELEAAGKYISNPVYLVSPLAASRLKMLAFNNAPVVLGDKLITGKPFVETPLLSGDRVILGDFTKMVVGVWDKLSNYTFNPVSKAKDGLVEIIVNSYFDAGAINPNAFVYAKVTARTDN